MCKVSVIVPNYNHAEYLTERIESILSQRFQDFELILLDDCSTDNSKGVLEHYRDNAHVTHIVYNTENSGSPFHQWAKGVSLAQGEWVWIAESDDWAEPELLETLLNAAHDYPNCGLIYGLARRLRDGKEPWATPYTGKTTCYTGGDFARRLILGNVIYNVSMALIRKELLKQVPMEALGAMHLCGDWMLYAQLCRHTDILEVSRIVSNYRMHNHNTSSRIYQEGGALIEGMNVIRYIARTFHISPLYYARHWGREWMKQERDIPFTSAVQKSVRRNIASRHPFIFAFYIIYRIKRLVVNGQ